MRLSHTLALATVLAFAAACSNPESPTNPELGSLDGTNAITCNVSVTANTMNCDSPNPNARSGPNYSVSLGGQNNLVQLAATGSNYSAGAFTFTATGGTVKNLTVQPMGTANGSVADTGGVKVFFYSGPTCTGAGTATVTGNDGAATFTAASQKYYKYAGILAPNATTAGKAWTVALAGGCTAFTFQVLVNSVLPQESGILKWDVVNAGTSADLTGVSTNGTEVWAVGAGGTIVHYNGSSWSTQASGHSAPFAVRAVEIHGSNPARGVAVGDSGTIFFYNGTTWSDAPLNHGTAALLNVSKVGETGSKEWWACGGGGVIFHTIDSTGATGWAQVTPTGTGNDLHVCGGSTQTNVYAIGNGGVITHWAGTSWSTTGYTSNTTQDLYSASGGNGTIYVGGANGTIISSPESPGTTFTAMTSGIGTGVGADTTLYGGESSDQGHPYFVGFGGVIVYLNDAGTTWLRMPSGTTTTLNDVAISGGNGQMEAWAVGNGGLVLHGHR